MLNFIIGFLLGGVLGCLMMGIIAGGTKWDK